MSSGILLGQQSRVTVKSRLSSDIQCLRAFIEPTPPSDSYNLNSTWYRNVELVSVIGVNPTDPENIITTALQDRYAVPNLAAILKYSWTQSNTVLTR